MPLGGGDNSNKCQRFRSVAALRPLLPTSQTKVRLPLGVRPFRDLEEGGEGNRAEGS